MIKTSFKAQFALISTFVIAGAIFLPGISFAATNITSTTAFAWGDTLGWVNFSPTNGNVTVTDTAVTGYAWSANYGWINLAPTNGGVVNDGVGNLSGKAWGAATGWIDFTGISIDSNGQFKGETAPSLIGVVNFSCANCLVVTSWRPGSPTTPAPTAPVASAGGGSSSAGSGSVLYPTAVQTPPTQIISPATESRPVPASSDLQDMQGNGSIYGTSSTTYGTSTYATTTNSKPLMPQGKTGLLRFPVNTTEVLSGIGLLLLIALILWKLLK